MQCSAAAKAVHQIVHCVSSHRVHCKGMSIVFGMRRLQRSLGISALSVDIKCAFPCDYDRTYSQAVTNLFNHSLKDITIMVKEY